MTDLLRRKLGELIGATHLLPATTGATRVAPPGIDALAAVMGFAAEEGLLVAAAGGGTWQEPDARATLIVETRNFSAMGVPSAEDFVMSAGCGATMDALHERLAPHGLFLPLDPPFEGSRTLGSVLATATSGALQLGYGPARDQVLGLTVVTGDGRIVRTGGATVKNVAGFDLMKLQIGGFGGFGILAECMLRLRARPAVDRTFLMHGDADRLTHATRALHERSLEAVAAELIIPDHDDPARATLAVRCAGGESAVEASAATLRAVASPWQAREGGSWWMAAHQTLRGDPVAPVTLRLGTLPTGIDETLDLLRERLPGGAVSAGVMTGVIRWSGQCDAPRLLGLRAALAAREIPMTLERAPWLLRHQVGHFGAYREGVGAIVSGLRTAFDPGQRLAATLDADTAP